MSERCFIGGRALGRVADLCYNYGAGELRERGLEPGPETIALSRLVTAVGGVCDAVVGLYEGRFDRRRNNAAAHSAAQAAHIAPEGVFVAYSPRVNVPRTKAGRPLVLGSPKPLALDDPMEWWGGGSLEARTERGDVPGAGAARRRDPSRGTAG